MSQSPMSITQLCNNDEEQQQHQQKGLESHDPEVRLAAEALGDLAQSANVNPSSKNLPIMLPPISTISAPSTTPSSPAIATPGFNASARQSFSSDTTFEDDHRPPHFTADPSSSSSTSQQQQHFIRRVSNHPLVHTALRAYESSKASSPVVKYGAEMVESIASPIYGKFGRPSTTESDNQNERYYPNDDDMTKAATTALANTSLNEPPQETCLRRGGKHASRDDGSLPHKQKPVSRSVSPHHPYPVSANTAHQQRRSSRSSRWQQLVVHAGSAAGTTAAVISAESMKCLKYCLSWLQYATQHIEQQMDLLRNVIVAMVTRSSTSSSSTTTTTVSTNHNDPSGALAAIKKEVIETLRKVVDVISKYAGTGLPEQAKSSVRAFILALPSRWALLNSTTTTNTTATENQSPLTSPTLGPHATPELQDTSIKLLNFGSESVEMLQSVSTVFSGTIRNADAWLDRLHSVGVTRHSTTTAADTKDDSIAATTPTTSSEQQRSDITHSEPMEVN